MGRSHQASLRGDSSSGFALSFSKAENGETAGLYDLFMAYQSARHPDSEMSHTTSDEFAVMIGGREAGTGIYLLRDADGKVMGGIITDPVGEGTSAVYSFFNPNEPRRSLGTQLVLSLIEETGRQNLPYVYLGYWIEAAKKMAYKSRFRPLQALGAHGWDWIK